MTPGNNRQAPPDRVRSRPPDRIRSRSPDPEPLAPLIDAHTHLDACGAVTAADVRA
ncbi:DNAase, partial [Mycobacteroides abscessus]|nr:DNAase [Mycobacteroides abscessus]